MTKKKRCRIHSCRNFLSLFFRCDRKVHLSYIEISPSDQYSLTNLQPFPSCRTCQSGSKWETSTTATKIMQTPKRKSIPLQHPAKPIPPIEFKLHTSRKNTLPQIKSPSGRWLDQISPRDTRDGTTNKTQRQRCFGCRSRAAHPYTVVYFKLPT